jgi:hypothetical protein
MPPSVFVVAVIAKTEATTLFLLCLREPLHGAPIPRYRGRRLVPVQRRSRQSESRQWSRKKAATHVLGWWPSVLFPEFQLPCQTHSRCKGLRVVDLDFEAEWRGKAACEQLHALLLLEGAGAGQERLKSVLVLLDGAGAATVRELKEGGRSQGWTVAHVEQFRETAPRRSTLVRLDLDIPQLRPVLQVVGRHPHLLLHDSLLVEVGLTAVDEDEGVGLAVVPQKVHLLKSRRLIVVVFTGG